MSREVIVRPEAEQDIREAHARYGNISPVLGEQFISAADQALSLASENPLAFQVLHRYFGVSFCGAFRPHFSLRQNNHGS